jgi:hypothetical protein
MKSSFVYDQIMSSLRDNYALPEISKIVALNCHQFFAEGTLGFSRGEELACVPGVLHMQHNLSF